MHDQLKLSNQLCFPLYTISKEITRRYTPLLEPLNLTYPQYLVMLVLWEFGELSVSEIGEKLHLDSGTLTPLLKRLQTKGLVERTRSQKDERSVTISLTEQGKLLENKAIDIPQKLGDCLALSTDEITMLVKLIVKLTA